jgi:S-adenosylmethionine-diacylglycerol 3-amino-3-carboxypropyl transferase
LIKSLWCFHQLFTIDRYVVGIDVRRNEDRSERTFGSDDCHQHDIPLRSSFMDVPIKRMLGMLSQWFSDHSFHAVHSRNLVYNTCWEDPRLDRRALDLGPDDRVMVITSAGCNALDYALDQPEKIDAVDLNPLQNALLELKIACIRTLDYEQFFALFGLGQLSQWDPIYFNKVRPALKREAQSIWDQRLKFFNGQTRRSSFYYFGTSGYFAWCIGHYLRRICRVGDSLTRIANAPSIEDQRKIYQDDRVRDAIWRPLLKWAIGRDTTMTLLGVPRTQRLQLERDYCGGIRQFVIDRLEYVLTQLSLADNYFWRVYLFGHYTPDCCPEYLKEANFNRLRDGLVDRIETHTCSVQQFLEKSTQSVSRFILLDHMDWLSNHRRDALHAEWQAIVDRASENCRILWRSAALKVDFIDPIEVKRSGENVRVGELLRYDRQLADQLHLTDRVQTYGSFSIADVCA